MLVALVQKVSNLRLDFETTPPPPSSYQHPVSQTALKPKDCTAPASASLEVGT